MAGKESGGKRGQPPYRAVSPSKLARLARLQAPTRQDRDAKDWMGASAAAPSAIVELPPATPAATGSPTPLTMRFGVPSTFPTAASYFTDFRGPLVASDVIQDRELSHAGSASGSISSYAAAPGDSSVPAAGTPSPDDPVTEQMTRDAAYALLDVASSAVSSAPHGSETPPMPKPLLDLDAELQMRNALFSGLSSGATIGRRATIAGLPSLASFGQPQDGHKRPEESAPGLPAQPAPAAAVPAVGMLPTGRVGRRGGRRRPTIGAPPTLASPSGSSAVVPAAARAVTPLAHAGGATGLHSAALAGLRPPPRRVSLPSMSPPTRAGAATQPSFGVTPAPGSLRLATPRSVESVLRAPPTPSAAASVAPSGDRPPMPPSNTAGSMRNSPATRLPARTDLSPGSSQQDTATDSLMGGRISGLNARVSSLETLMKQSVSELRQTMEAQGTSLEKVARAVGKLQASGCKAEAEVKLANDDIDPDADGGSFDNTAVVLDCSGGVEEEETPDASMNKGVPGTEPVAATPESPRHVAYAGSVVKKSFSKLQESVRSRADSNLAGLRSMVAIRPVLQTAVNRRIGLAAVGQHAYPPPDMITDMTIVAVQSKRGGSIEDAQEFLLSDICKPTKTKTITVSPGKPMRTFKASVPLALVLPHTIENLKKRMVPAWFAHNGVDMHKMSDIDAVKWLMEDKYSSSEDGGKGVGAAVKDGLLSLGADHRIKDGGVGVGQLIECTTGHFNMAACFVRSYLELIVSDDRGRRRKGKDFGWYVRYRAEGMRTVRFLPTDGKPYRGMVLVDAADKNKMMFDDDETQVAEALVKEQDKYTAQLPELLKILEAAAAEH